MRKLMVLLLVVGSCWVMSGCAENDSQVVQARPLKSLTFTCGPSLTAIWGEAKPEAAPATSQPVPEDK